MSNGKFALFTEYFLHISFLFSFHENIKIEASVTLWVSYFIPMCIPWNKFYLCAREICKGMFIAILIAITWTVNNMNVYRKSSSWYFSPTPNIPLVSNLCLSKCCLRLTTDQAKKYVNVDISFLLDHFPGIKKKLIARPKRCPCSRWKMEVELLLLWAKPPGCFAKSSMT